MWRKFRWDMFVTSFIPLWFSIIVFSIWEIVENSIDIWDKKSKYIDNIVMCIEKAALNLALRLLLFCLFGLA